MYVLEFLIILKSLIDKQKHHLLLNKCNFITGFTSYVYLRLIKSDSKSFNCEINSKIGILSIGS